MDSLFTSYRTSYVLENSLDPIKFDIDDLPIPDENLSTLLNPDRIIQINPWIFKFEPATEQIFALHSDDINLLSVLKENNEFNDFPEIRTFSYDDEVFAILNQEAEVNAIFGCNEKKASGRNDKDNKNDYDPCNDNDWDLRLEYDRFGIKESVWIRFKYNTNNHSDDRTLFDFNYDAEMTPKCEDKIKKDRFWGDQSKCSPLIQMHYRDNNHKLRLYNESRALSGYTVRGKVRAVSRCSYYGNRACHTSGLLVPTITPLCISSGDGCD